ncbi:hypothetical protein GCM10023084_37790 [Streptomyces lacrimifluminis]|uniref:Uncharacterized protein n=1 Tax=Streptomyces lacrimifluminis TaxID=1500077 RepID=A0A917L425_9ACTN|nr:hypothetical protein GCM10012282_39410 [Streptomyces lacrimifluminis]
MARIPALPNSITIRRPHGPLYPRVERVIDISPGGGGSDGGLVSAQETPEHVTAVPRSPTGTFLRALLERK